MPKLNFEATLGLGSLLIAEPFQNDNYFKRAVVLLSEHDNQGTLGFILNKPTDLKVNDAVDDFPTFDAPLYFGGPVNTDLLFYIHTVGKLLEGSLEIIPGVYWGGDYEKLMYLADTKQVSPGQFRFFAGYSGWEPGQLKEEIREKVWIPTKATRQFAFADKPRNLWSEVLRSMGNEFAMLANFPEDPHLN
jgi:putative transcriptional regulator